MTFCWRVIVTPISPYSPYTMYFCATKVEIKSAATNPFVESQWSNQQTIWVDDAIPSSWQNQGGFATSFTPIKQSVPTAGTGTFYDLNYNVISLAQACNGCQSVNYDCINGVCVPKSQYNTPGLYETLEDCQLVCGGTKCNGICLSNAEYAEAMNRISKIDSCTQER